MNQGFRRARRLSGLPLVHRVCFIVYAGERFAKPLMFGKTLSTMDDGRKGRGTRGKREKRVVSARARREEGEKQRGRSDAQRATRRASSNVFSFFFFYHLELGKFSSPLSRSQSSPCSPVSPPRSTSLLFGSPTNFAPFDPSNSLNCYSVAHIRTEEVPSLNSPSALRSRQRCQHSLKEIYQNSIII